MTEGHQESRASRLDDVVERWILGRLRGEERDLEAFLDGFSTAAKATELETGEVRRRIELFEATRAVAASQDGGVPRVYGDFAIQGEIGRGGMGVVYRARQISLDRDVALKVLPSLAALDGRRVERFLREASVLSGLEHPGIVPVHTAGEDHGTLYFAMPHVRGVGLDVVLEALADVPVADRSGARVAEQLRDAGVADAGDLGQHGWVAAVVGITEQMADALAYAHAHGVVHRDVKPSNVILGEGGRPMLIDFGLAKGGETGTLTASRDLVGTPSYLPPESIRGGGGATERGDVYSLGVVLYELLCGRRPFEADSIAALLGRIERADFDRPRALVRGLPRDLENVCLKAMECDPERRYASMADLAADLCAFREYRPVRARPAGALRRARMLARRRPALAGAAALLLALGLGTAITPSVRAAVRARDAAAAVTDIRTAVREGRLERAEELLDHLAAIDEGHAERPALARAVDLARTDRALLEAAGRRDELEQLSAELARLAPEILVREKREGVAVVDEADRRELARLRARRESLRAQLELRRVAVENALHLAETWAVRAGVERHPEVQRAFADLFAARFRAARDAGDEIGAELNRELVRARDDEGRYEEELLGLGTLRIDGPADARAWLFRYVRLDRARSDQWRDRLVPVPFRETAGSAGEGLALRPGDVCIEILDLEEGGAAERSGLRAGDYLYEVDGSRELEAPRVVEVMAGSPAAAKGVRVWDRITAVGETATPRFQELLEAETAGGPFRVAFESEGMHWELPSDTPAAGIDQVPGVMPAVLPALLADVAPPRPILLRVLRGSTELEIELPAGEPPLVLARMTAAPLLVVPESRLDALPATLEDVEPGSYLLLVRRAGCRDLRVPLVLPPLGTVELRAEPPVADAAPPRCVWIPPGELRRGTDPLGTFSAGPEVVHVEGFWIGVWELTMVEWWGELLTDPGIMARIDERLSLDGILHLVPRDQTSHIGMFGELASRWMDEPVRGLDFNDVRVFLEHLNRRLEREGSLWIADVPTDVEWERAAAGADDRPFPWGRTFDASLCASLLSKRSGYWEPVHDYPVDESPFGVQGMAGSVSEWTSTVRDDSEEESRFIYGGSRHSTAAESFRIQGRFADATDKVRAETGFRLVFRPRRGRARGG